MHPFPSKITVISTQKSSFLLQIYIALVQQGQLGARDLILSLITVVLFLCAWGFLQLHPKLAMLKCSLLCMCANECVVKYLHTFRLAFPGSKVTRIKGVLVVNERLN